MKQDIVNALIKTVAVIGVVLGAAALIALNVLILPTLVYFFLKLIGHPQPFLLVMLGTLIVQIVAGLFRNNRKGDN